MADKRKLKPGAFYWVIPTFDVDFVPPGFEGKEYDEVMYEAMRAHWSNKVQPARFAGHHEGNLDWERWIYLGQDDGDEGSEWPAIWVGDEIKIPEGSE